MGSGWHNDKNRHSLSAQGSKTRKSSNIAVVPLSAIKSTPHLRMNPATVIALQNNRATDLYEFWVRDEYDNYIDKRIYNNIIKKTYKYYTYFLPKYEKERREYDVINETIDTAKKKATTMGVNRMDIRLGIVKDVYTSNKFSKGDRERFLKNFVKYELAPRYGITNREDMRKIENELKKLFAKSKATSITLLDLNVKKAGIKPER